MTQLWAPDRISLKMAPQRALPNLPPLPSLGDETLLEKRRLSRLHLPPSASGDTAARSLETNMSRLSIVT